MKYLFIISAMITFTLINPLAHAGDTVLAGVHDLGSIGELKEFRHEFSFKNSTGKEIKITHIDSSCPCLQVVSYPAALNPGAEGTLVVRFYPYGEGRVRRVLTLVTDSEELVSFRFIVKADLQSKLEFKLKEVDGVRIASEVLMRRQIEREKSLYLSAERVEEKLRGSVKPILIDVRDSLSYNSFNIPGSINMPLYTIKTRNFLRSKEVIIVAAGYDSSSLEDELYNLKRSGYRVLILKGGINSWMRRGFKVSTTLDSELEANQIVSRELFKERDFTDLIIIDASTAQGISGYWLPTSHHIPFVKGADYKKILKSALSSGGKERNYNLLIFNANGEGYEEIEKSLKGTDYNNIFYLYGGLKEYKEFLKKQTQMLYPAESVKKLKSKKCGSCP